MKKVHIFIGSLEKFQTKVPDDARNLTDVVMELDKDAKSFTIQLPNSTPPEKEPLNVTNFVIYSNEYSGVREHVVLNFANFLAQMDIEEMYLQNPPLRIIDQIEHIYSEIVEYEYEQYPSVTADTLRMINSEYPKEIIGQDDVKNNILSSIYPLLNQDNKKPVVMLFYGASGVGKTETAQFIARIMKGKLLRRQFSMYQNNEFATYLFGGSLYQGSFARDLLDRESNVILLDEFDKANPVFHSAFYQLFDEGVYEDQNYTVNVEKAIIICTSNYSSKQEIKDKLGEAIYNRFDAVIGFKTLNKQSKDILIDKYISEYPNDIMSEDQITALKNGALKCDNARSIKRLIQDAFSLVNVRKILADKPTKSEIE